MDEFFILQLGVTGKCRFQNGGREFDLTPTPMTELRGIRLYKARDLIAKEGRSVTDAAFASGFRHLGKFSKYFRLQFGLCPSDLK